MADDRNRSLTLGTEGETAALAACLDRLAAGDMAARDLIIGHCAARLHIITRRMLSRFPNVRRWDDTDDVFQNAVMRLYHTLGKLAVSDPREVMALAATEIHRELIDLARKHAGPMSFAANHATNLPGHGDDAPVPHVVREASVTDECLERWERFHDAITRLPHELRDVFQLVWYLDADTPTIARLLACSERTVQRRWNEARQAINVALDGLGPE